MLKSEIDISIKKLLDTIDECEFVTVFDAALGLKGEPNTIGALKAYAKFLKISASFNAFENQVLEIFGLEQIREASFWSAIVKPGGDESTENLEELSSAIKFLQHYLPKVMAFKGVDDDKIAAAIESGAKEGLKYVNLSVVVIEEEELSSPKRLSTMLDSIQGLYEVVGRLKNMSTENLLVTAVDSGHDKKFDFLGSSEIIEGVKEVILSLWDRVVYFRDDKSGEHLQKVTESLPLLIEINEAEQAGSLEMEEAEILRRRATASITKFSQAGLTIPEMEDATRYDPRDLMRPDRRSIAAPSASGLAVVEDEEEDDDYFPDRFEAEPAAAEAPEPEPVATPEEEPKLETAPEPEPVVIPEEKPAVEATPEPESVAETKEEPKQEAAPEPEPVEGPEAEPAMAAAPETEPVAEPKEEPKQEAAPEPESVEGPEAEPAMEAAPEADPFAMPEEKVIPEPVDNDGLEDFARTEASENMEAPVDEPNTEEPVAEPEPIVEHELVVDLDDAAAFMSGAKPQASEEAVKPAEPEVIVELETPEVLVEKEEPDELQAALEKEAAEKLAAETATESEAEPEPEADAKATSPSPFGLDDGAVIPGIDDDHEDVEMSETDAEIDDIYAKIVAGYKEMKRKEDAKKSGGGSTGEEQPN